MTGFLTRAGTGDGRRGRRSTILSSPTRHGYPHRAPLRQILEPLVESRTDFILADIRQDFSSVEPQALVLWDREQGAMHAASRLLTGFPRH